MRAELAVTATAAATGAAVTASTAGAAGKGDTAGAATVAVVGGIAATPGESEGSLLRFVGEDEISAVRLCKVRAAACWILSASCALYAGGRCIRIWTQERD